MHNMYNATFVSLEMLDSMLPPLEWVDEDAQSVLIAMYTVTAAMSFFGNVTVLTVLLVGKRSSRTIRTFLVSLAVADINMALFCIPFTFTSYAFGRWLFHPNFCPFVQFMQHLSVTVSVYTLTAIGIDRYFAIMYPLKIRWTKSRGKSVIGVIWVLSAVLATIQFSFGTGHHFQWGSREYYDCNELWPEEAGKAYTLFIFLFNYALPLASLAFTYSSIAIKLWRHTSPGNADRDRDLVQLKAKRKVIKMLATVVMLFAICWLPLHIFILLLFIRKDLMTHWSHAHNDIYNLIFFCCHWTAMANSFVNPIIYSFMSGNFLVDLKQIMMRCSSMMNLPGQAKSEVAGRAHCFTSVRSTTSYFLSFRNNSGSSQGVIHVRKSDDRSDEDSKSAANSELVHV